MTGAKLIGQKYCKTLEKKFFKWHGINLKIFQRGAGRSIIGGGGGGDIFIYSFSRTVKTIDFKI